MVLLRKVMCTASLIKKHQQIAAITTWDKYRISILFYATSLRSHSLVSCLPVPLHVLILGLQHKSEIH